MSRRVFGVDFGTRTLKIFKKDEGIIIDQKNVIAIANRKNVIAGGNEAFDMFEKAPMNIKVSYPVKNGVIGDFANMQSLFNYFIKRLMKEHGKWNSADYLIAVPTDITEVEKRAFFDLVNASVGKAKKIGMVEKPIAAALGIGLDITNARGVMTVDMGADTTEISIMSLGGIVLSKLIPVGGSRLDESIKLYVKKKYNLLIGDKTAEVIKKELANAYDSTEDSIKVYGRNVVTGLPSEMEINASMVFSAIREHIYAIIDSIRIILERTPPEISSDIIDSGIYLTGGSSKIKNIDKLISEETELLVNVSDDPENSVAKGLGVIISDPNFTSLAAALKQPEYTMNK